MIWSVKNIYQELLELEEQTRIEAKRGTEIGASIMQTICAFANEPGLGGGWLLLGVAEPDKDHSGYWIQGIEKVDNLLNDLQINCRNQFEQPITIHYQLELIDGKRIAGIFIPELEPFSKPCRFKGKFDSSNRRVATRR